MINNEQKFDLLVRLSTDPVLLVNMHGEVIKSARLDGNDLTDDGGMLIVNNKALLKNCLSTLSKNLNLIRLPITINGMRYRVEGTRFNPGERDAVVLLYLKKRNAVETKFDSLTQITDLSHELKRHVALEKKLLMQADELRQSEKKLKEISRDLDASNKELKQFAYVASHDLQAPLNSILGFADLLSGSLKGVSEMDQNYLDRIVRAGLRMKSLIDDLLAYSRITANKLEFEEVNLNEVCDEALKNLDSTVQASDARISMDQLPVIKGVKSQFLQLFQNLISNAIKYVGPGVTPEVKISVKSDKDRELCIEVEDNGIGIDEKYFKQIFQPFKRLHNSSEYQGSGVGLSICRKVVAYHKGDLSVASQLGKGSKFTITLPMGSEAVLQSK